MKEQTKYQRIFLVVILLGFFILMLQQFTHFSKVRKLKGAIVFAKKPNFSWSNWFSSSYQDSLGIYANENFGFRPVFVRINNQLAYSLFDHARANGVTVGKEGYLYEEGYINAYLGRDFIGDSIIREKVNKLKEIQVRLKKRNIDFVVVFAPGKGSFYPKYFPKEYDKFNQTKTNYEGYVEEFQKSSINFIDFRKWFLQLKGKTIAPLFPKTGIHWSRFGELMAGDSLLKYIERDKGIRLPRFNFTDTLFSFKTKFTDADIEQGMNLLYNIPDFEMAYPSFTVEKNENTKSTRAMVVGDSYYFGLFNHGFSTDFLSNGQFWYYFEEIYEVGKEKIRTTEVDIKKELQKHNIVILLANDAKLLDFAFGFIDEVYPLLNISDKQEREERIKLIEISIMNTPEWYDKIKKQAAVSNITVEKALRDNAENMVWVEDSK